MLLDRAVLTKFYSTKALEKQICAGMAKRAREPTAEPTTMDYEIAFGRTPEFARRVEQHNARLAILHTRTVLVCWCGHCPFFNFE